MNYQSFLQQKAIKDYPTGIDPAPLSPLLFPFQKDIVNWALRRGRAAIFCGCGMGKTIMQLEWAKHVPGDVLILAPLAVGAQTVREGQKFGIDVQYCRNQEDIQGKITITNYEMLDKFDPNAFNAVVIDESSILKSFEGKIKAQILEAFGKTPFRLACTATPAPNDYMELGNHAEFLNVMNRQEMLSMFFVHDGGETQKWRLKGHAERDYWRWLTSWAVMIQKPSDIGYDDGEFLLPPLTLHHEVVSVAPQDGYLFPMAAQTLEERIKARKSSIEDRIQACTDLVTTKGGRWIIWCNLNDESSGLVRAIPGAVEVKGSDSLELKESRLMGFVKGEIPILISKPSIAGFGLNMQVCHQVAFVGLSDSWEQYYQAVRRCWRFGQKDPVDVYIITAATEGAVVANIERKERDAERMIENMVEHMADLTRAEIQGTSKESADYNTSLKAGHRYAMNLGDCVELTSKIASDSIHYSIFSPPFSSLYTYSNSERDMGNCKNNEEFLTHFKFLVKELYRIIMPGRLLSFHCMNLPTSKTHHGYIGIVDFRGALIQLFQEEGWIYHSEVCIWKDPVTAMQRTKALGLLHKQLKKDSCMSRQGIPDYLVTMRKPGNNPEPVHHTDESFPVSIWQRYASPIWMDINPSDTLQHRSIREEADEKHICPLQLEVIDRALELWSNPNDVVLSPFAGIGSEGYVALKKGRRFIGMELKESYYKQACANLQEAEENYQQQFLIPV